MSQLEHESPSSSEVLARKLEGVSPYTRKEVLAELANKGGPEVREALARALSSVNRPLGEVSVVTTSAESASEQETFPFSDAAKEFGNKRIDVGGKPVEGLLASLEETVRMYRRMGLDEALKRKGSSLDAFGAQLQDSTQPNKADLQRIIATANAEGVVQFDSVFEGGPLLPHELGDALFVKSGIPYWKDTYGLKNLRSLRRVTPEHFNVNISELARTPGSHRQEFVEAYRKAPEWTQSDARLIFTPNTAEVSNTGVSATRDLADGVRTLDINANMLRFRTFMERGLRIIAKQQNITDAKFDNLSPDAYNTFMKKCFNDGSIYLFLPDKTTISRSSRCVFPNGGVAALFWRPDRRVVRLFCYDPDDDSHDLGSRSASG